MRQAEYLPFWFKDETAKDLVLSDDIDSLLSCAILQKIHPNWKIKYFYNFKELYKLDTTEDNERVWVDVAVQNGEMAFDNHVSLATDKTKKNENMINPNFMLGDITTENYTEKYSGSTAMMLWALYDIPIPQTDVGKAILWNIDVGYKGILSDKFYQANYYYFYCILELFELCDWIRDNRKFDFYNNREKYKLNSKIKIQDGKLNMDIDLKLLSELLGIDIELPTGSFLLQERFVNKRKAFSDKDIQKIKEYERWDVLSAAFTKRKYMNFSRREKV